MTAAPVRRPTVPFSALTPQQKRRWWRWVRINQPALRDFLATQYRVFRVEFGVTLHIDRNDLLEALK